MSYQAANRGDRDNPYAGKPMSDGTYSTFASQVQLSAWRFLRYHSFARSCFKFTLIVGAITAALSIIGVLLILSAAGWMKVLGGVALGLGILVGLVFVCSALLVLFMVSKSREFFESAMLTPGVVISVNPLECVSLAPLGRTADRTLDAIRREKLDYLPEFPLVVGTRFPCVSTFTEGDDPTRWKNFTPTPLSIGTGDLNVLNDRLWRMGDSGFFTLEQCIRFGRIPAKAGELLIVDEER